ncbi:MAG: hypothetical protein EOO43_26015 [Flavobacterium sp.]|nr:MAG: hypothetical protein EOO43_26015 [Flavobacterium sp.]
MVDFDFPYKKENMLEVLSQLRRGNDIVVGKRTKKYFQQLPLKRRFISKLFSLLNRLFLQLPLCDTQSGLKGFNTHARSIFLQTTIDRFLIDTEFLLRAHRTSLSIRIIEIELNPHIEFSNFNIQVVKTELQNFRKLMRLNKELPTESYYIKREAKQEPEPLIA